MLFAPQAQAYLRLNLEHWFPKYEDHWVAASVVCEQRLQDYFTDDRTRCDSPCACAAACIFQNATGTIQSNFASAQVLLGILPSVLMFGSPTIAEVAALSTYRPLLAVLLSLGSPAVSVGRLFHQIDFREPFNINTSKSLLQWSSWVRRHKAVHLIVSVTSYIGAVAAIGNNARNSMHLDLRTISGWRCGALFLPLSWSLAGILVQVCGMLAIRVRPWNSANKYRPSISFLNSNTYQRAFTGDDSVLSETLFGFASLFAIVQMILRVFVLSSLLFISALEALQVFVLYAVSTLACPSILVLELASMRLDLEHQARLGQTSQNLP